MCNSFGYGAGPFAPEVSGMGRVFYVGATGTDGNEGIDPSLPFATITYALSQCVSYQNDVIVVLADYWQPAGETWPILVNKHAVHIVGRALPNLPSPAIHPPNDTAAFQLSSLGQYGEIAFLTIGGGVSHGGIEWGNSGQVDGFYIHDCCFGHEWFGAPLHGIYQPAASTRGGYGCRIERCTFMGDQIGTGVITGNGISLEQAAALDRCFRDLEILDCVFKGLAIGVNAAWILGAVIAGNRFTVPDAANGEAVTLLANCDDCLVDDNRAMNGGDGALGNTPYRDISTGPPVGSENHWGQNYAGAAAAALPVCA
jgi:hypothetical protein